MRRLAVGTVTQIPGAFIGLQSYLQNADRTLSARTAAWIAAPSLRCVSILPVQQASIPAIPVQTPNPVDLTECTQSRHAGAGHPRRTSQVNPKATFTGMYKSLSILLEGIILIHLSVAHQPLETWADGIAIDEMVGSNYTVSGRLDRHNARAILSTHGRI